MDRSKSQDVSCDSTGSLRSYDHKDLTFIALHERVRALLTGKFDIEYDEENVSEWLLKSKIFVGEDELMVDGELVFIINANRAVTSMHVRLVVPVLDPEDKTLPLRLGGLALVKDRDITAEDIKKYLEASRSLLQWNCNGCPVSASDPPVHGTQQDGCVWHFSVKRIGEETVDYVNDSPVGTEAQDTSQRCEKSNIEMSEDPPLEVTFTGLACTAGRSPSRISDSSRYYAKLAPSRRVEAKYDCPITVKRVWKRIRKCARRLVRSA